MECIFVVVRSEERAGNVSFGREGSRKGELTFARTRNVLSYLSRVHVDVVR